jgi:hypothetical protein
MLCPPSVQLDDDSIVLALVKPLSPNASDGKVIGSDCSHWFFVAKDSPAGFFEFVLS